MSKYLDFYYECMKAGEIPEAGLCFSLDKNDLINLFTPSEGDIDEGDYWGYDGAPRNMANDYLGVCMYDVHHKFTPLRQTIVLLLAAMNGEL